MAPKKEAKLGSRFKDSTKFEPDPNCPRIIPMQKGDYKFRHPVSGVTLRLTLEELRTVIRGELINHKHADKMFAELAHYEAKAAAA